MDNYEIFINYRREGGQEYARPLALELEKRGYKVFLDYDALTDGKFDKRIMDAIDSAPVFISILSPHCLDRCVNADDWVRQEIEYAYAHEKHIIPINPDKLFEGFTDKTPTKLKEALGQHQFSEIMMGMLYKASMDKMVAERIAPILGVRDGRYYVQPTEPRMLMTSVLKVETDLDCHIFVDGKERGIAKVGDITYVDLRSGTYRLRFVAIEDSNFVVEERRYHIDRDTEEFYSVVLIPQKKVAEEKKREEEKKKEAEVYWETGENCYKENNYIEAASWYRKAAELGSANAQNSLGICYECGEGIAKDYKQAFLWYEKAAEQGLAKAQGNLGYCYDEGVGTTIDKVKAALWYQKAADQGDAGAQCNLGYCYSNGEGIATDKVKAKYWYQKAAEQGHIRAQCNLGYCYENGQGTTTDEVEAVYWYKKAAEQGDASAQFNLGQCYEYGKGVTKNYKQALLWYGKAANKDSKAKYCLKELKAKIERENPTDAKAQNKLGDKFYAEQKYTQAVIWYQKAAEQGFAKAQFSLGYCYDNRIGTITDKAKAVYWYQKAAKQGLATAQFCLGCCYSIGEGTTEDKVKAVYWWTKAAKQGHSNAQHSLGNCFENGEGVSMDYNQALAWYSKAINQNNLAAKDSYEKLTAKIKIEAEEDCKLGDKYYEERKYTKAISLFNKAAEQGNVKAQFKLGYCYDKGIGTATNQIKAEYWYHKAAEQGHPIAQMSLGYRYDNGINTTTDKSKAVYWYHKAAEQGLATAQSNLGMCYYEGEGTTADAKQAIFWFQKAADQGDMVAQYGLGNCYAYAKGTTQDLVKGAYWYQKAAEQGYVLAQLCSGYCYELGAGVAKNYDIAMSWYSKAANKNNPEAKRCLQNLIEKTTIDAENQYKLGNRYYKEQKYTQALSWYQKAAEQGHVNAQYRLGECYENGYGTLVDNYKAMSWYCKASSQDCKEAKLALTKLNAKLRNEIPLQQIKGNKQ